MDWQQAASLAIVAVTSALFVRGAALRRQRQTSACGGNCSCGNSTGQQTPAGTQAIPPHGPGRS